MVQILNNSHPPNRLKVSPNDQCHVQPSVQLGMPNKVSANGPKSLAEIQISLISLKQVIQQRCNQILIHSALIVSFNKEIKALIKVLSSVNAYIERNTGFKIS